VVEKHLANQMLSASQEHHACPVRRLTCGAAATKMDKMSYADETVGEEKMV
jgi:hypothetical protein